MKNLNGIHSGIFPIRAHNPWFFLKTSGLAGNSKYSPKQLFFNFLNFAHSNLSVFSHSVSYMVATTISKIICNMIMPKSSELLTFKCQRRIAFPSRDVTLGNSLLFIDAKGCNCVIEAINIWPGLWVVCCSLWHAFLNDFYSNLRLDKDAQHPPPLLFFNSPLKLTGKLSSLK